MIRRSSLIFSLILTAIFTIYAFLSHQPVCNDPTGCIWIGPIEPASLGVGVITTGADREMSVEIQHSLELSAGNIPTHTPGHFVQIQPYFSSCLPDVQVQSTIDLSADHNILAVIGPICGENTADFSQRMLAAAKISISPVPYRSIPNEMEISIHPDSEQFARQTAEWVNRLGFSRVIVLHDTDVQSSALAAKICESLSTQGTCTVYSQGLPDFEPAKYDAVVEVFLDESNPPTQETLLSSTDLPQIVVSFSRPQVNNEPTPSIYWIGPALWNELRDFSNAYFSTYDIYPTSFAAGVVYSRLPMIYNMISKTAITTWDGSWVVPLGKLKQAMVATFADDAYFCQAYSNNCPQFPLALFQVTGNEYKSVNP